MGYTVLLLVNYRSIFNNPFFSIQNSYLDQALKYMKQRSGILTMARFSVVVYLLLHSILNTNSLQVRHPLDVPSLDGVVYVS
jgi:hypothetical protein